jgi:ribosomal protein RSM22 (predicted rRNA methylase)
MTVAGKYLLRSKRYECREFVNFWLEAHEAAEADSKNTMLDHNIIEYKRFLPSNRDQKFDLIILSNILSELPNSIVRDFVIQELWSKCDGVMVVLENQGQDHFEIVERARSVALELGDCSIIAPVNSLIFQRFTSPSVRITMNVR